MRILGSVLTPVPARLLLALACGLGLAAAFPPYDLWPLAPLAVAGLGLSTYRVRARVGALVGLVAGVGFFLLLLEWLRVVGVDGWLVLSLFEALYLAPLGAGLALVSRLPGWPLWSACLWVAEELIRSRVPFGGLPWGKLAFSQADTPLTPLVALGGAPLLSFAVALAGGLVAAAAVAAIRRTDAPVRGRALLAAGSLAGVGLIPVAALAVPTPTDADSQVMAAVVQGNVPRAGLDFQGQRRAVLNNHVRATHQLADRVSAGELPRPDIVIWPENATDIDPYTDASAHSAIDGAVRAVDAPALVGAVVAADERGFSENTGIVWDPSSGPGETYVKRHPVPFGEYLPIFRSELRSLITRFQRVGEYVAGDEVGTLQVGEALVGDLICFEVAYDELARDVVGDGAELIVVQTNNATYGQTNQPEQQWAMSRLRAVEHGRTVVVAATSGISGVVAPDGSVAARAPEFQAELLVEPVALRDGLTLADRVGAVPEWLLAGVGVGASVLAGLIAWVAARRATHSSPAGGADGGADGTRPAPEARLAGPPSVPSDIPTGTRGKAGV